MSVMITDVVSHKLAGLPRMADMWARALNPSSASFSRQSSQSVGRIEFSPCSDVSFKKPIATFLVNGEPIWITGAHLDGIDASNLLLFPAQGFDHSYFTHVMCELFQVPTTAVSRDSPERVEVSGDKRLLAGILWKDEFLGLEIEIAISLAQSAGARSLTSHMMPSDRHAQPKSMIVSAAIILFQSELRMSELSTIKVGDIVLAEFGARNKNTFISSDAFTGRHAVFVKIGETSMTLSTFHAPHDETNTDEADVSGHAAFAADESVAPTMDDWDGQRILPTVRLECVLPSVPMALDDFCGLQRGHVISIPVTVSQASVEIHLGGRPIGRGQLITVGEQLAVRILDTYLG